MLGGALRQPTREGRRAGDLGRDGLPGVLDRAVGADDLDRPVQQLTVGRPVLQQAGELPPALPVGEGVKEMYSGFPVGYLLFWGNLASNGARQIGTGKKQAVPRLLIVDGQQRLTTMTLLIAALLLGLANAIVRPILIVLTFPLTLITLGLFLLVINGAMVGLVSTAIAAPFFGRLSDRIGRRIAVWAMAALVAVLRSSETAPALAGLSPR